MFVKGTESQKKDPEGAIDVDKLKNMIMFMATKITNLKNHPKIKKGKKPELLEEAIKEIEEFAVKTLQENVADVQKEVNTELGKPNEFGELCDPL